MVVIFGRHRFTVGRPDPLDVLRARPIKAVMDVSPRIHVFDRIAGPRVPVSVHLMRPADENRGAYVTRRDGPAINVGVKVAG